MKEQYLMTIDNENRKRLIQKIEQVITTMQETDQRIQLLKKESLTFEDIRLLLQDQTVNCDTEEDLLVIVLTDYYFKNRVVLELPFLPQVITSRVKSDFAFLKKEDQYLLYPLFLYLMKSGTKESSWTKEFLRIFPINSTLEYEKEYQLYEQMLTALDFFTSDKVVSESTNDAIKKDILAYESYHHFPFSKEQSFITNKIDTSFSLPKVMLLNNRDLYLLENYAVKDETTLDKTTPSTYLVSIIEQMKLFDQYSQKEKCFLKVVLRLLENPSFLERTGKELNSFIEIPLTEEDVFAFIKDYEDKEQILDAFQLQRLFLPLKQGICTRDVVFKKTMIKNLYRNCCIDQYGSYKDFIAELKNTALSFPTTLQEEYHSSMPCHKEYEMFQFLKPLLLEEENLLTTTAGFYQPLLATKTGQKLLLPLLCEDFKELEQKSQYHNYEVYEKYINSTYDLRDRRDYNLDCYMDDFIPLDDHEKFKHLCLWLRKKDQHFFEMSIDHKLNEPNNYQRLYGKDVTTLNEMPLKEITEEYIVNCWKKLTNEANRANLSVYYRIKKKEYQQAMADIVDKRLQERALFEMKNLSLHLDDIRTYLSTQDYTTHQALKMITFASITLPEEKIHFEEIATCLKEEQHRQILEEAQTLMESFFTTDVSSMTKFYEMTEKRTKLKKEQQQRLLDYACEYDAEMKQKYDQKQQLIKNNRSKRCSKVAHCYREKTAKKRLDDNKEKIVKVIQDFLEADTLTAQRFCRANQIDRKVFNDYLFMCRSLDTMLEQQVTDKMLSMHQQFIKTAVLSAYEVAKEMVHCHKEKRFYDLYHHYETYGYGPEAFINFAKNYDQEKIAKTIQKYMKLHPTLFSTLSRHQLEVMKQTSSYGVGVNLYIDNEQVFTYKSDRLVEATTHLEFQGMPITRGTLYGAFQRLSNPDIKEKKELIKR